MCLWVCYQSVTCFTGERGLELCVEGPAVTDDDSIEMKFIITKAKKAWFLSYMVHKYTIK